MVKAKYFGDKRSNHDWTIMMFKRRHLPKECDGMRLPLTKYGPKEQYVAKRTPALRQGQVRIEQCAVMTQKKTYAELYAFHSVNVNPFSVAMLLFITKEAGFLLNSFLHFCAQCKNFSKSSFLKKIRITHYVHKRENFKSKLQYCYKLKSHVKRQNVLQFLLRLVVRGAS